MTGYFWVSYFDKWCTRHPEMGAISFQDVEPLAYDVIYYHDYHGWRDTMDDVKTVYNAFIASSDHEINAVSFYTAANDCDYTIVLFDDIVDGEPAFELSRVSGTCNVRGFHTVDLLQSVGLRMGDDFYVQCDLSTGGQPYDRTSVVPVLLGSTSMGAVVPSSAKSGESYYLDGSSWVDLTTFNETANFCIKALGISYVPDDGDLACYGSVDFTNVRPGQTVETTIQIENTGSEESSLCWEVASVPEWGQWTINPEEGSFLKPHHGPVQITVSVVAPREKNTNFSGTLSLRNCYDGSDIEEIDVTLKTVKQFSVLSFIEWIRDHFRCCLLG
jgi:hypothetical protein